MRTQRERRAYMIRRLLQEHPQYAGMALPEDEKQQRMMLRGLMNMRSPQEIDAEFLAVQDEYLQDDLAQRGVTDGDALPEIEPGVCLWQGDITTLKCDAIVNAANSGMTGCYAPNHRCIDNCIHTFAGVQLRLKCEELMQAQGHEEPTGCAKLTPAYNLPCRYVLHTVGPIIDTGIPDARDCALLASCYRACLELAARHGLESVAFCCISTGEFRFPNERAAEIAVATVREFLQTDTTIRRVIFNVFKDVDREIYARLLG